MTWIEFSKQRPKEEPKRQVLVEWADGTYVVIHSDNDFGHPEFHRWTEIEPPTTSSEEDKVAELMQKISQHKHDLSAKDQEALAKIPVTEEQVAQFEREHEHEIRSVSESELKESRRKLFAGLNIPEPSKPVPHPPRPPEPEEEEEGDGLEQLLSKKSLKEMSKPDPFEEWWLDASGPVVCDRDSAKAGWDAAMKHKEAK